MARGKGEPDPAELLVRALDQVVGGIALARYAASRTEDSRLKGLFRLLVATGEQQERLLRQHLSGAARELGGHGQGADESLTRQAVQMGLGAAALAAGFGAAAWAVRAYREGTLPEWLAVFLPERPGSRDPARER